MRLNAKQNEALDIIPTLKAGDVLVISGAAGTGKTALLSSIEIDSFVILAPTGKAASRVRESTEQDARTIHSFIYHCLQDPITGFLEFRKPTAEEGEERFGGIKTVIIDEASMLSPDLWTDIKELGESFGWRFVLIGDEHQLPPVMAKDSKFPRGWSVFGKDFEKTHSVELTEIHRQALDSPIITAATAIRTGKNPVAALYESLESISEDEVYALADPDTAIVCHTNEKRRQLNEEIRRRTGNLGNMPSIGEPLMVTKNAYGAGVFNGEVYVVKSQPTVINKTPILVKDNTSGKVDKVTYYAIDIGLELEIVVSDLSLKGAYTVNPWLVEKQLYRLKKTTPAIQEMFYVEANWGYAFTCHKCQGSQWKNVVVLLEPTIKPMSLDGRRWLYTSLTRAEKSCKFVML